MTIVSAATAQIRAIRSTVGYYTDLARFARAANGASPKVGSIDLSAPLEGEYVVSTSDGIFGLTGRSVIRLSKLPVFGVSIGGAGLFATSWASNKTYVVASKGRIDFGRPAPLEWNVIYSETVRDNAGRFHQIGQFDNSIWIANTARNALTKLDAATGEWLAHICPFKCSFDHPIDSDHNHVNSVWPQKNYLVFTAFKIFRQGAVGIVGNGRIEIFRTPNMGIHDCFFSENNFFYCDSFNFNDNVSHGSILINNAKIDDRYLETHKDGFVRGVARHGDELVVGSSCFSSDRAKRLAGQGHVLVMRNGAFTDRIPIPAGQIYDIVRLDGAHSDAPPSPITFVQAFDRLCELLGPPVQSGAIEDCFVGRSAKKFDASDIGHVPEYAAPST